MRRPLFARAAAALALLLAGIAALSGCDDGRARLANRDNFTAATNDFLAQRGHLCLGLYDWPVRIAAGSSETAAEQMQLLEKLGLVRLQDEEPAAAQKPAEAQAPVAPARNYQLTDAGRKYYLQMPVVLRTAAGTVVHPADLCAATLHLDRLIGWDPPQTRDGRTATSLLFTYRIAPEPWAATADARQGFPLLARAMQREGTMQLRLGVHLTSHGWMADELELH